MRARMMPSQAEPAEPAEPQQSGEPLAPAPEDVAEDSAPIDLLAAPGTDPPETLLELYKLAVEMADRVSARRGHANSFFLSIQTAFVGVSGVTATQLRDEPWWVAASLAAAGVSLSVTWWLQLRGYRTLNTAKFEVINAIEPRLPARLFSKEWELLIGGEGIARRLRYTELGRTERKVPWVFALLHVALCVGVLST
jgi:hypothetical protein